MKKFLAKLELYSGEGKRKTAFKNGYRPLFGAGKDNLKSGMITLVDKEKLNPGERAVVEIKFVDADFPTGTKLYFYEGIEKLGECEIVKILN